jgi:hypothetical protein
MFPADYFRYCSSACTMDEAFKDLTYSTHVLNDDGTGVLTMSLGPKDGLKGRIPCKLFYDNIQNTIFKNVFKDLEFSAFINFDSYKFNTLGVPYSQCRGIKLPPDLLKNNINLTEIEGLFNGITIEVGVDINSDLLSTNVNLINVSSLFRNILFNEYNYYGVSMGDNP